MYFLSWFTLFFIFGAFVLNQVFFAKNIFLTATSGLSGEDFGKSFDFKAFYATNPGIYGNIDPSFLQWFIGFSEGDGSFLKVTSPKHQDRCAYWINQADLRILKAIQSNLGIGRISTYTQKTKITGGEEDRIYGRFVVDKPEDVLLLIRLFNGNMHIKKCQKTFETWVTVYNNLYKTNIKVKPLGNHGRISLDNKWLVGFWEADGGFSASLSATRLRPKAYLDQDQEEALLKHIASLFEGGSVYYRKESKSTYRVDFQSYSTLKKVQDYCTRSPLVGRKNDAFVIWSKIVTYFYDQTQFEAGNLPIVKDLTEQLKYQNAIFKIKKSVLVLEELDEAASTYLKELGQLNSTYSELA